MCIIVKINIEIVWKDLTGSYRISCERSYHALHDVCS
jgi:hypothetical protein